jgi:hypothetical protein
MTLDLVQVAEQMPRLLERLVEQRAAGAERRRRAQALLGDIATDSEALRVYVRAARTRWPLALPLHEPVDAAIAPQAAPESYLALATDGSHIDVDRHAPVECYVLNLGWAVIRYGAPAWAVLESRPNLEPTAASLLVQDDEDASADHAIRGETLALLRTVRELDHLAALVDEYPAEEPALALLDGNLGLWNVDQAQVPAALREQLCAGEHGMLPALNRLRDGARPLAFAAYTSKAGSSDVAHTLRIAACPLEEVACERCPRRSDGGRPCDDVGLATDAELFAGLLRPGERSAVFRTFSRGFLRSNREPDDHWYEREGHAICFFYLRLEDEVARVELPEWMAAPERLALLHALVLDQCRRGPGYPVSLQEAHEAAVISMADRRSFAALLERELAVEGLGSGGSAKSRSKRLRGI